MHLLKRYTPAPLDVVDKTQDGGIFEILGMSETLQTPTILGVAYTNIDRHGKWIDLPRAEANARLWSASPILAEGLFRLLTFLDRNKAVLTKDEHTREEYERAVEPAFAALKQAGVLAEVSLEPVTPGCQTLPQFTDDTGLHPA
jgi:hypothetical protein